MSNNELLALGALVVACLFAAAFLFRSWRRRRTRPPLIAAVVVLAVGTGAIALVLLGAPYRDGGRARLHRRDAGGPGLSPDAASFSLNPSGVLQPELDWTGSFRWLRVRD